MGSNPIGDAIFFAFVPPPVRSGDDSRRLSREGVIFLILSHLNRTNDTSREE